LSPLVQVMQQPSLLGSHFVVPQHRLTWQHGMPFHVQQQLHKPSHTMRQRFCSVAQATSSSHLQRMRKPPVHFSNFSSQRGSTAQFAAGGAPAGAPPV
jgi:hypothetical protein